MDIALTEAAVLVPIYRNQNGRLRLIIVRRAAGGPHGSQLAFPGGKAEPQDTSLRETALREAEEEIGLSAGHVTVLAALPPAETMTTRFRVSPFLGRIVPPARWQPRPGEVAEVLDLDVAGLSAPEAHGEAWMHFAPWPAPRLVGFYRVGPDRLWGLTYRILRPLLPGLLVGEWPI